MLTKEEILELWQSGGDFREIAATEIVKNFDSHADLFFQFLQQDIEPLCSIAKNEMPFLRIGYAKRHSPTENKRYSIFQEWHELQNIFYKKLDEYLSLHKCEKQELISLIANIFEGTYEDLANKYNHITATDYNTGSHTRQLMIFVTGKCNLKCPYCFSSNIENTEIDVNDLHKIFKWAQHQNVSTFTPCGGEPLLYKHFQQFLNMVKENNMTTYFASNFTIDISKFDNFDADIIKGIYVHLTPAMFEIENIRQNVCKNINLAKDKKIELVARINLTKTTHQIEQWLDFINENGIKRLHVALTIPSANAENSFIPLQIFKEFVPVIENLINKAYKRNIAVGFSKPVPLCLFPKEFHKKLIKVEYEITGCNIYNDDYMHNVCLSPALEFTPCLGLSRIRIPFSQSIQWEDLKKTFKPYIINLLEKNIYPHCDSCFLKNIKLCQGICLSYKEKND